MIMVIIGHDFRNTEANNMKHNVSWATVPLWFRKELRLIDPTLTVEWNHGADRWIVYHEDGSPSLRVENPKTKAFRDLDQRTLRKLRINIFFTHNNEAMELYLSDNKDADWYLRSYINRGVDGISDYLSGWDKD